MGKRLAGIKVVNNDYKQASIGQCFARFFLGILDSFMLVGIIISLTNKKRQRIGDLVAKTIVVKTDKN